MRMCHDCKDRILSKSNNKIYGPAAPHPSFPQKKCVLNIQNIIFSERTYA